MKRTRNPESRPESDDKETKIELAIKALEPLELAKISREEFEDILNRARDERDHSYQAGVELRAWKADNQHQATPEHTELLNEVIKIAKAKVAYLEDIYRERFPEQIWRTRATAFGERRNYGASVSGENESKVTDKNTAEMKEDRRRFEETKFTSMVDVLHYDDLEDLKTDLEANLEEFQAQQADERDVGEHERDELADKISLTEWQLAKIQAELLKRENDKTVEDNPRQVG